MVDKTITKKRIVDDLRNLGLRAGDAVLVHSALSSIGEVDGGARTVIEALLEVLTPEGTLVMPTFGPMPFDIKNTPSGMGIITETFRKYPGVVRSFHPTHSVAVLGPKAQELIRDHLKSPTACGAQTPFGRLTDMGGKILLLGVDQDRNTTLHMLEELVEAPYLSDKDAHYLDDRGQIHTITLKLFPGPHRDFISLDSLLREKEVETIGYVGQAVTRLIDARKMREVVIAAFRKNPALVLCDNPNCRDCVMQRKKIRLAQLKKEHFILSALASSVAAYPDVITAELNRAGIGDVIVDRLYDRPVWRVEDWRLKRAASTFIEEQISVGAIYGPADTALLEQTMAAATTLGATMLILPLGLEPAKIYEQCRRQGFDVMFENCCQTAGVCAESLKAIETRAVLAMNPAGFAMMGENPFLYSFTRGGLRHRVGMLFLTDATWGGRYTAPGEGNGEVKEILSILRCSSFPGRVVLGTGSGGPEFRDIVSHFWHLLETM